MSMKTKDILLAAGGASLWGGSGAAAQQLFMTHAVTTEWLVAVRLLGAGLLLLIWGLIKSSKQINEIIHDRKNMAMVLAFAIFGVMNSQLSYFFAIKYSNAPTATVLQYLQPVLIVLWMAFGQKIRPRRVDGISIVVALMGTFLLVTGGRLDTLTLTPIALAWGLWSAVAATLYTLLPSGLLKKYDAMVVCGLAMFVSGIIMLPWFLTMEQPHLSLFNIVLVIYIVVFGTMFAYTLFLQSIRYIAPSVTGILSAFEPLIATILAVTLLGTKLSTAAIIGSLLIVLTTVIQAVPFNVIWRRFRRVK
ncbi:DMT family transporter [Ligilactobacillus salivarius]|uniref:DMT family transporter n=1 Tax=Ligilactobacillus salivarius TaxID=1624 RepID=UPI0034DB7CA2